VRREVSVEAAEPIERTFPSTAGEVEQDEATERVRRVLARLPEDYRTVLRLHFWENLSWEDVGLRTNRSADAARKLHTRAMRAAAEQLEGLR
jgi:RNA polymerase sigma factor (sigma-70 family)